jgi:uncharacterized UBP type Zn finger protein
MSILCEHLQRVKLAPAADGPHVCENCSKTGETWMHLRKCLSCGVVLCCDSSPHQHMSKHHASTGHPVVVSAQPGERWAWCYVDE